MILTKDNLLRYIRENKAVTPTIVAESFETTTTIASAALSELAKEKLVAITYLKLSSSPYYYDPNQNSVLIELGEKHLSKNEKDIFYKLKEKQILSENSMTVPERLAIGNIKDFAYPLEITAGDRQLKFWVWYQRDLNETRRQILDALNANSNNSTQTSQKTKKKNIQEQATKETNVSAKKNTENGQTDYKREEGAQRQNQQNYNNLTNYTNQSKQEIHSPNDELAKPNRNNQKNTHKQETQLPLTIEQNEKENFIENYLKENYLTIESKQKEEKGINYQTNLKLPHMTIEIDCYFYYKKPSENQLIRFYTSSLKPKIVFIEKCPKKLLSLGEAVENLKVVNV